MFERFTRQVRDTVVRARQQARELGHDYVGCEHLLLAALSAPEHPGADTFRRLGVTPERFRSQLVTTLGAQRGFDSDDAEALRTLGIDLGEVKRRVESSFGPGALDRQPPVPRGWLPWRRQRCGAGSGRSPFTDRAKQALKEALREALQRGDRHIGVEHLLLAMLRVKGNVARQLLHQLGVDSDTARRQLLTDLDHAA